MSSFLPPNSFQNEVCHHGPYLVIDHLHEIAENASSVYCLQGLHSLLIPWWGSKGKFAFILVLFSNFGVFKNLCHNQTLLSAPFFRKQKADRHSHPLIWIPDSSMTFPRQCNHRSAERCWGRFGATSILFVVNLHYQRTRGQMSKHELRKWVVYFFFHRHSSWSMRVPVIDRQ